MKVSLFSAHKEYKDPRKNNNRKIIFGLFFIFLGFAIALTDANHSSSPASASGNILHSLIILLISAIGKYSTVTITIGIGIVFIISGLKKTGN